MTIVIPTWFVILWAVSLVFGIISSAVSMSKFDKMSETIANRAIEKMDEVFVGTAEKIREDRKCSNTKKQGSGSQKSQKK